MDRLNIKDIINNAYDELDRARELLSGNEAAVYSMLLDDIDSSLDRLRDVAERIDFALILAVYTGALNAQNDFEHDCDNSVWRDAFIEKASTVELEYADGYVDSEWAYETANAIAKELYAGNLLQGSLAQKIEEAGERSRQTDLESDVKVLSFVDDIGFTQFSVDAGWYEKQENKEDVAGLFEKASFDEKSGLKDLTGKYLEPEM